MVHSPDQSICEGILEVFVELEVLHGTIIWRSPLTVKHDSQQPRATRLSYDATLVALTFTQSTKVYKIQNTNANVHSQPKFQRKIRCKNLPMQTSHAAFLTFWITFASFEVVVSQRVTSLRMKSCEQGGKLSAAENKRSLILISAPLLPPLLTLLPDTAIIAGRTCKQGTSGARTEKTPLRGFCSLSLNQYLFRNDCKKHRHK